MTKTPPISRFEGEHRFLSNFYPSPLRYNDVLFSTVEHGYQYARMTTDEGREAVMRVRLGPDRWRETSPGEAKRARRRHSTRHDWDQVKVGIMLDLLRIKFDPNHPELRALLLATGDAELIEGNAWGDNFWGVANGWGENHLGRLLMQVRNETRSQPTP
jgi:ribA/ribD-fused uncharacterized protein